MSSLAINPPPNQRQGRLMLALIVGLLALPFIIGAALYFGGWQPPRISHHGHLISPPRQLSGQMLRSAAKNGQKWIFMVRVAGPCDSKCLTRLDEIRRIHVALYKNMSRVSRAVLTDQPDDPALLALSHSQPDLLLLAAPPGELADIADTLLLVDPQGQLVITYPADASPQGMRADLERLLKYAWNG
jgi:hypothetical protein